MDGSDAEIAAKIQNFCFRDESVPAFVEAMRKVPQHKCLVGRIFVSLCATTFLGRKYRFFAEAMLNCKTGHTVNVNFRSPGGASALHLAARNHDFELIGLLLSRGARTDLRGLRPHKRYRGEDGYDFNCEDKIPLELAFFTNPPYSRLIPSCWTSNSGLLFGIFAAHFATEFVRKSFELLTKNTEKIGRVVYRCVKEAMPEVLALLLLADREKVLSSNMLEENDGFSPKLNRVMTIQEAILAEIASANEDRSNLTGRARSSLLYRKLESKEQKLTFCLKLLQVFDKAEGALNALLLSKNGQKVAVREVATLLEECGCELSYDDSTHPGSTQYDLDDLDTVSELLNGASDLVEVANPFEFSYLNIQDGMRCSIMYSPEAESKYHSECLMKYDHLTSDAIIVLDAEKHIFHHGFFNTGQAKSTFIKFVKTIPAHKTTLVNNILIYTLYCAFESKRERFFPIYRSCILSLLNGETGHRVDVNFLASCGFTALHVAAIRLNKEAVEFLLLHGASADIRVEKPRNDVYNSLYFDCDDMAYGKLPLELSLPLNLPCDVDAGALSSGLVEVMGPKADTIELIGLLVSHTKGISQVAVHCIKEAAVQALVVLVLAAYERVVSLPLEKGIGPSEGFMTFSEYIMMEIVNVTEESLKEKGKGADHSQVKEVETKKKKLMFVLCMFEAIEAARKSGKVAVSDIARFMKGKNFNTERCVRNAKGKLQKFQDSISVLQVVPTSKTEDVVPGHTSDFESLTSKMSELQVSGNPATEEASKKNMNAGRRIRLLRKKIRVARRQQKDKQTKLESWKEELQLLKDKKAETAADHDQQTDEEDI